MSFFKSIRVILERNSCECLGVLGSCRLIGFSWEDVGEDCFGGGWLAILEMCLINLFFSWKIYVYCNILR